MSVPGRSRFDARSGGSLAARAPLPSSSPNGSRPIRGRKPGGPTGGFFGHNPRFRRQNTVGSLAPNTEALLSINPAQLSIRETGALQRWLLESMIFLPTKRRSRAFLEHVEANLYHPAGIRDCPRARRASRRRRRILSPARTGTASRSVESRHFYILFQPSGTLTRNPLQAPAPFNIRE